MVSLGLCYEAKVGTSVKQNWIFLWNRFFATETILSAHYAMLSTNHEMLSLFSFKMT